MAPDSSLRAQVAEQLSTRSAAGGPLHRDAVECTGHSAIITAGAPGSGKSLMLRVLVADLADYRIIDADTIKDDLIKLALVDGIYDDLLAEMLADGHALAPRELAGLVHVESEKLADQIRRICINRKENVVIEGTLTWDGQGPRIFRELADAEYKDIDIEVYRVDVEAADAHEQALEVAAARDERQAAVLGIIGRLADVAQAAMITPHAATVVRLTRRPTYWWPS